MSECYNNDDATLLQEIRKEDITWEIIASAVYMRKETCMRKTLRNEPLSAFTETNAFFATIFLTVIRAQPELKAELRRIHQYFTPQQFREMFLKSHFTGRPIQVKQLEVII